MIYQLKSEVKIMTIGKKRKTRGIENNKDAQVKVLVNGKII